MKRFLAIILCAALVIAMVPAVFAAEEEITYNFTTAGQAVGNWSYTSYYKMSAPFIITENGTYILPTNGNAASEGANGVALKITVPDGVNSEYIPMLTYAGIESGGIGNVYLISVEDEKSQDWYEEAKVCISVSNGTNSLSGIYRAIADSKTTGSAVKKIIADADSYNADVPTSSLETDFSKTGTATGDAITLTSGEYWLIFGVAGANASAESYSSGNSSYYFRPISLTFEKKQEVIDKTHIFNINTTAMTTEASTAAAAAYTSSGDDSKGLSGGVLRPGTGLQFINELSETDLEKSNRWALRYKAPNADGTASPQDTASLTIDGKASSDASLTVSAIYRYGVEHIDSRLALMLEVLHEGKYKLSVTSKEIAFGAAADVYMIPETDVINNGDAISLAFIKKYKPIGRIDIEGESGTAKTYDIGTVNLTMQNYYIIFSFNTDNTTTYKSNGKHYFYLRTITLTEDTSADTEVTPDAMTQNELSFSVNANVAGAEVTADIAEYTQGSVTEVSRGKTISLEAKPLDGYEFVGWKRGGVENDERGIYLDKSASFDYKIMTNTYLTAVYVEKEAATEGAKAVGFWNEYGAFIACNEEEDGYIAVPDATLTGHQFDAWYENGTDALTVTDGKIDASALSGALTRAMAKYSGTTAVSGYAVANGSTSDYQAKRKFGDAVTSTDASATCWRRDGKIVAYDVDTYTHYVWDATQIISSYEPITEKTPVVVLDDTAIDNARMIEYDRGDTSKYEICEVGILFGSSDGMVISSCEYKATSQKNDNHGQFTAAPADDTHTYARGYMIYKDLTSGSYNVVYAD